MKTIRVGGVPEHFNLPWHLCMEEGDFEYENIEISWKDYPGGTGVMNSALRNNEIDVAVILTEGVVKDIIAGNPSKIVHTYVESPLIWGIHVAANSNFKSINELKNTICAISRKGSGSELMAYVNAENQGWDTSSLKFEVVGDLNGAVEALTSNKAHYFMWEHYTTKPLVDTGVFRRLGDCPTPWPSFVIAVSDEILHKRPNDIEKMLGVLDTKTASFNEVPGITKILSKRYSQKQEDIEKWMEVTSWSQHQIKEDDLEKVQDKLKALGLIEKKVPYTELVHNFPSLRV